MSWTTDVTVAAVIEEKNRFLLVYEKSNGKFVYNQPAGHVEAEESLTDALIRECLEETGFKVQPIDFIGVYQLMVPRKQKTYLRFAFHAERLDEIQHNELDDGIIDTFWLTEDEIKAREPDLRNKMVLQCISDYRNKVRYPIDIIKSFV